MFSSLLCALALCAEEAESALDATRFFADDVPRGNALRCSVNASRRSAPTWKLGLITPSSTRLLPPLLTLSADAVLLSHVDSEGHQDAASGVCVSCGHLCSGPAHRQ